MRTNFLPLLLLLNLGTGSVWAAQAQLPEAASAVQELTGPSKTSLDARNWRLDPAVFTEITPFTAPDIAIELPIEQQEQEPVPSPVVTPVPAPVKNR